MISEHKFYATKDDKTYYAYVCVEVKINTTFSECTNIFTNKYEDEIAETWIMSALEGMLEASEMAIKKGFINNLIVRLVSINGTAYETDNNLIKCAAINAVWKAITPKQKPLKVAYQNKRWQVEYPTFSIAS